MTATATFRHEWTAAEVWDAEHPGLAVSAEARPERVRWMAVARTVTALEGTVARFTVADDPAADTQLRTTTVGTVIGRALLDTVTERPRWLILVRPDVGPLCAIPEDRVVDIADA